MRRLFDWLTNAASSRERHSVGFLLPADRTQVVIDRERKRAERIEGSFSLLVLSATSLDAFDEHLESLAESLAQRLRATDVAGFLDRHRIGVLLPGTPGEEAWKVARAIPQVAEDGSQPFRAEVFGYPTYQFPERQPTTDSATEHAGSQPPPSSSSGDEQSLDASAAERHARHESHACGDEADEPEIAAAIERPELEHALACGADAVAVQPLEDLFIRRVPLWKRTVDITGALFGLLALSPLMLATAVLIKLTSPGPVFFRQLRDGLGGVPFTIYKFRTMSTDAEARKAELRKLSEQDGPAFKLTNDPRITPLGRFLRKTCIDELPQFWNVLKGDMSLVGPRPLDCKEARHITGWGRRRLEVTPGLTCIWQVHGKSKVSFAEWMRMDIRYLKRRTFLRDMKLVFETVAQVIRSRGSV